VTGLVSKSEKPLELVYVKFFDHQASFDRDSPGTTIEDYQLVPLKPIPTETVGWLIYEDNECLLLAHDIATCDVGKKEPRRMLSIVKSTIKERKKLTMGDVT